MSPYAHQKKERLGKAMSENTFNPQDPFKNPDNEVTSRMGTNGNPNDLLPQFNQHIWDPKSSDYGSHRGYVIGTGRQFQAGTERAPKPPSGK